MTKSEIISFLLSKTGYLKTGADILAYKLKADLETVKQALKEVKINRPITTKPHNSENQTSTVSNPKLLESFKSFIEERDRITSESFKTGIHLVMGCNHVPFHNQEMTNGILKLIETLNDKLSGVHFIGDFLDMNSLSKHDIGKVSIPNITLGKEYKEGNRVLDMFDKSIGNNVVDKTFIYGNHEDRYLRHIADIDNSKYADAILSPKQALCLDQRGYKTYTNWKESFHIIGKNLQLLHGEFCTKSPARTHMDKIKSSVMFAHTHRIDIVYDGEKAGFNIGWGGDKNAPAFSYVSRITKMNWINGFALVTIDEEGNFHTQVIPVYKNKFWYNGQRY